MITSQVIDTLYKKYRKLPKSIDCLDFGLLFDSVAEHHNIEVDMDSDSLILHGLGERSPFYKIPLSRIHAIVPFEEWVAIVLHSSIIFLNRNSAKASVHVKPPKLSFVDRLKMPFVKDSVMD